MKEGLGWAGSLNAHAGATEPPLPHRATASALGGGGGVTANVALEAGKRGQYEDFGGGRPLLKSHTARRTQKALGG